MGAYAINFYKHHLGDYDAATAHLSWLEDAAYMRLLRVYYRREKPLADVAEACRLTRAVSAKERAAVKVVLSEFFEHLADGWHNKRADEEIETYQAQASTNRRIAQQRTVKRNGNESLHEPSHEPLNDSSRNREPNHKPLAISQEPDNSKAKAALPAVQLVVWLKAQGITGMTPANPDIIRWAQEGVTEQMIIEAVSIARTQRGKGDSPFHFRYLEGILTDIRNPPERKPNGNWRGSDEGIEGKGRELGMQAKPGETYREFADRIASKLASVSRETNTQAAA